MRRQGRDREGVSALRVRLASGASEAASRWEEIGLDSTLFVLSHFPHRIKLIRVNHAFDSNSMQAP